MPPQRPEHRNEPSARATAAPLTAAELGLKLTGIIVGPKQSVALINGRPYRKGTQIACEKGGSRYSLRLVEVRRKDVVLECRGTRCNWRYPNRTVQEKLTGVTEDP